MRRTRGSCSGCLRASPGTSSRRAPRRRTTRSYRGAAATRRAPRRGGARGGHRVGRARVGAELRLRSSATSSQRAWDGDHGRRLARKHRAAAAAVDSSSTSTRRRPARRHRLARALGGRRVRRANAARLRRVGVVCASGAEALARQALLRTGGRRRACGAPVLLGLALIVGVLCALLDGSRAISCHEVGGYIAGSLTNADGPRCAAAPLLLDGASVDGALDAAALLLGASVDGALEIGRVVLRPAGSSTRRAARRPSASSTSSTTCTFTRRARRRRRAARGAERVAARPSTSASTPRGARPQREGPAAAAC